MAKAAYNAEGENLIEGFIRLTWISYQTDDWHRGRTMERLGIKRLSVSELTRYVTGISKHHVAVKLVAQFSDQYRSRLTSSKI